MTDRCVYILCACVNRGVVKSSSGESLPAGSGNSAHPYKIPQQPPSTIAKYDSDFPLRKTGKWASFYLDLFFKIVGFVDCVRVCVCLAVWLFVCLRFVARKTTTEKIHTSKNEQTLARNFFDFFPLKRVFIVCCCGCCFYFYIRVCMPMFSLFFGLEIMR